MDKVNKEESLASKISQNDEEKYSVIITEAMGELVMNSIKNETIEGYSMNIHIKMREKIYIVTISIIEPLKSVLSILMKELDSNSEYLQLFDNKWNAISDSSPYIGNILNEQTIYNCVTL